MSEPTDHDAGAERPHSLRHLLLRIGGTLVALLVLYLLSIGPAAYYVERRRAQNNSVTFPVLERIYAPTAVVLETPAGKYFLNYIVWWRNLALRG